MGVSGTPTVGAQNCILYPYRIVGSATSIQLPRLSGFVPVGDGDDDGVEVNGYRHMDTEHGHFHTNAIQNMQSSAAFTSAFNFMQGNGVSNGSPTAAQVAGSMTTDGTNGPPRPAKNTSARTAARNCYTWAQVLNAVA